MEAISKTGLDTISRSQLHYWYKFVREDREEYTPDKKTIFDQALRCLIITPELFREKYVVMPDINLRTNIGKAELANLKAATEPLGQILIKSDDYQVIHDIRDSVIKNNIVSRLLQLGVFGEPTRYIQPDTGVEIKFLPHLIYNNEAIVNISTIDDVSPKGFQKKTAEFNLHKKAALQMDGTGLNAFIFVVIEPKPPYNVGIYSLDARAILYGRELYIDNCKTYAECLKTGVWMDNDKKIETISLPEWAYK